MPYRWTDEPQQQVLRLWPHQSLTRLGYVGFIGATMVLVMVPLFIVVGSILLWGLLPFVALAVGGMIYALDRNRQDSQILEELRLDPDEVSLTRQNPRGPEQSWQCNSYWASAHLYPKEGPVPNYLTLRGGGREVELGAFLTPEERTGLYDELQVRLAQRTQAPT